MQNWKSIHTWMLGCAALAAGLPNLEASLPPAATPLIKAAAAVLVLIVAVLGAVGPSAGGMGGGSSAAAKTVGGATSALMLMIMTLGALAMLTDSACNQSPSKVASDVSIGLQGATCVLDVGAADAAAGKPWRQILADAVAQCAQYGIDEAKATGLLQSHRAAEIKEGFVPRPIPGAP